MFTELLERDVWRKKLEASGFRVNPDEWYYIVYPADVPRRKVPYESFLTPVRNLSTNETKEPPTP